MRPKNDQIAGDQVVTGDGAGSTRYLGAGQDSTEGWTDRSRIVLTPIAAPSILGLFGFAGATFMVASLLAGWWGSPAAAFYTAGAMMLAGATGGRTILPLGKYNPAANIPGRRAMEPVSYPAGLPGARVGQ
jgi:hypothetical protein